ncbi:MAG TPA: hypothetical protein VEB18_03530 [Candidatus Paceibacterota bacterium]|nr:hypothetical protein [Candidatus Paceibacterota bacterium]
MPVHLKRLLGVIVVVSLGSLLLSASSVPQLPAITLEAHAQTTPESSLEAEAREALLHFARQGYARHCRHLLEDNPNFQGASLEIQERVIADCVASQRTPVGL